MDAEGEQEEGEIMPEREKTDKGRTLLHEARQAEGAASNIRRIALVPSDMTIDPNSIKDSITDMMTFFIADPAGAAYASVFTILDTQPLSTDPKMILNGPGQRTIHRAIEVSHTNVELMQLFDAMVVMRENHGGIDVLGVPLYFMPPTRASEKAAETEGMTPPAQYTFTPSHLLEVAGMGTGLTDTNLDEIADMVCAVFGGLHVATLLRCRMRNEMTGVPCVGIGREQNE